MLLVGFDASGANNSTFVVFIYSLDANMRIPGLKRCVNQIYRKICSGLFHLKILYSWYKYSPTSHIGQLGGEIGCVTLSSMVGGKF